MRAYSALARYYDALTQDVPYEKFADFYARLFERGGRKVRSVLDLACGTGTLTRILAERGYDMTGADASEEMLSAAYEKMLGLTTPPLLIRQRMEELDLYGTVDAVVCALDGINYVPPDKLGEVFRRVLLFLEPGGIFIFDVNTPLKLKSLDGQIFLDETDDVYCVWRVDFDREENACFYGMDIFSREGNKWLRSREEHAEYAYGAPALEQMLLEAGFTHVGLYGELKTDAPSPEEQRVFLSARKPE